MLPPDRDPAPDPDRGEASADARAIRAAKNLLRKAITLRRDLRPVGRRRADDAARVAQLLQRLEDHEPSAVAAYLSKGSEPGTLQLVAWLAAHDIRILLPVLTAPGGLGQRTAPAWAAYEGPDSLRLGVHTILEPTGEVLGADALGAVQLVVCPAMAASAAGLRLGRGGGWYDRALSHASPHTPTWVLLNDDEVLQTIPTDSWDRPVTAIATPTRFLDCGADTGS